MPHQAADEGEVLLTASNEFGNSEVVDFEAKASATAGVLVAERNEPLTPAIRQHCCLGSHAVSIVAECLMKWRAFSNGSINQVAIPRVAEGEYVGLDGNEQINGSLWKLAEDSLTANNDKFVSAGDSRGGPDDVFKLVSLHGGGVGF
jgi:hypothetical protein